MNLSQEVLGLLPEDSGDWATEEFYRIVSNQDTYPSITNDAPYTARTAEAKARELFPEGVPGLTPEEFAGIDWEEIANDWNGWARDEGADEGEQADELEYRRSRERFNTMRSGPRRPQHSERPLY